jgi:inward rectifier potassium channel
MINNCDGGFNVVRIGASNYRWRDPYHLLLTLCWYKTLALISLGYVLANTFFALAYLAGGDGIENARPGNFFDAFFFQCPDYGIYRLWGDVSQNSLCQYLSYH